MIQSRLVRLDTTRLFGRDSLSASAHLSLLPQPNAKNQGERKGEKKILEINLRVWPERENL